jgi:hypothetical protein
MRYMLLIYDNETTWARMSEPEHRAMFQQYRTFSDSLRDSGAFLAGAPLQPTTTATTVRLEQGKTISTDGPYAETKEQLGGYYLIEAKNLDDAIAIAARIPSVQIGGSIEVRPVMEVGPPSP